MKIQPTSNPRRNRLKNLKKQDNLIHDTIMNEEIQEEDREFEEPKGPVDPPQEKNPHKRKPAWVREFIQGVER